MTVAHGAGVPPGVRFHVDTHAAGLATGWAFDPAGKARLSLTVGGERLASFTPDVTRRDADAVVGETGTIKGFGVPTAPVATALMLTAPEQRGAAALSFGEATLPIAPALGSAPCQALAPHLADVWLCDSQHLRLRTKGGVTHVTVAQIHGALVASRHETPDREAMVTARLDDPFAPVLVALATREGTVVGVIPFPSLLRGGLHAAEGLACAGGRGGLPAYAFALTEAFAARRDRVRLTLSPGGIGTEPLARAPVRAFVEAHADVVEEGDALVLAPDEVPTLALLMGADAGPSAVSVDGAPRGTAYIVDEVRHGATDAFLGVTAAASTGSGGSGVRPSRIRRHRAEGIWLEALRFPLPPEDDRPLEASALTIVLTGGDGAAPSPSRTDLPASARVLRAAAGPLTIQDLCNGPAVFLDSAIVLHDPRTLAILAGIASLPGVASAGCMIVREDGHGDTSLWDRAICGLFPTHAAADQPWRPPLGPLAAAPVLGRRNLVVAANHPACLAVNGAALAQHGQGISRFDARDLLTLQHRASAAGLVHVLTTFYSVADRRTALPPLPARPTDPAPAGRFTTLRRLI